MYLLFIIYHIVHNIMFMYSSECQFIRFLFICYMNLIFIMEYCLQILDTNPQLFFHLQQQRLIELIRNGKVEEALEFAQEELAPRGEENVSLI